MSDQFISEDLFVQKLSQIHDALLHVELQDASGLEPVWMVPDLGMDDIEAQKAWDGIFASLQRIMNERDMGGSPLLNTPSLMQDAGFWGSDKLDTNVICLTDTVMYCAGYYGFLRAKIETKSCVQYGIIVGPRDGSLKQQLARFAPGHLCKTCADQVKPISMALCAGDFSQRIMCPVHCDTSRAFNIMADHIQTNISGILCVAQAAISGKLGEQAEEQLIMGGGGGLWKDTIACVNLMSAQYRTDIMQVTQAVHTIAAGELDRDPFGSRAVLCSAVVSDDPMLALQNAFADLSKIKPTLSPLKCLLMHSC